MAKGKSSLRKRLPVILENEENRLSKKGCLIFSLLFEELKVIDHQVSEQDKEISILANQDERCKRLQTIPGVGPITATALVGTIGSGEQFEKGRQLSAYIGLTPRQSSSGGKERLLGISKKGNCYLRGLFIHGARAVVSVAGAKTDRISCWIQQLEERKHRNITIVALANKNARMAWAILNQKTTYSPKERNSDLEVALAA